MALLALLGQSIVYIQAVVGEDEFFYFFYVKD